ncbi:MAG TPA: hypothetical protein PKO41_10245 [Dokdonella sp.]|uniref:hypothetical protein n=1 Tax=Dokdonella sp. TaxID=2291710 RepID=UPI0025B8C75B|nr:hypothetical protein [Dokdonella sp.]HNR92790.1 hypothetical protein [Dokdonella sp.]
MQQRNRKRFQLILIASLFFLPMLIAGLLVASGWVPDARSHGEGIVPQRSFDGIAIALGDGELLQWKDPDWRWSVVALPGRRCGDACQQQLDLVHRARVSLNQNAMRVRLLYVGEPPAGDAAETLLSAWQIGRDVDARLAEWTPDVDDGLAIVLVKPDGTALIVYRNGFDASGLRKDLAKVTK